AGLPSGKIIRGADERFAAEEAGRATRKAISRPSMVRMSGMGIAPFLLHRAFGLPYGAGYGAAAALQSPAALSMLARMIPKSMNASAAFAPYIGRFLASQQGQPQDTSQ